MEMRRRFSTGMILVFSTTIAVSSFAQELSPISDDCSKRVAARDCAQAQMAPCGRNFDVRNCGRDAECEKEQAMQSKLYEAEFARCEAAGATYNFVCERQKAADAAACAKIKAD